MIRCTRGMGTPPISCFLPSWVGVGVGVGRVVVPWGWGTTFHEDVIKWKRFPRYWSFVRGIHRPPVNSSQIPHKGQWLRDSMLSLICAWTNDCRDAGDVRRHRTHYDVTVISWIVISIDFVFIFDLYLYIYSSAYIRRYTFAFSPGIRQVTFTQAVRHDLSGGFLICIVYY